MNVGQQFESGVSHHRAGRLAEAERIYRQILASHPDHVDVLHLLGALASQLNKLDDAEELVRRVIRLKPDSAEAHNTLGLVLAGKGEFEGAVDSFRRAIQINPNQGEWCVNLGNALKKVGQIDEAIALYRRAIGLKPDLADAYNNLGNGLRDKGQLEEAISSYRQAIWLKPGYAEAHNNLGNGLMDNGQFEEAIASYRQAIGLKPDYARAHDNLGNALVGMGQLDEAIALHRKAIRLKPDFVEAHSNLVYAIHFHAGYDAKMIQEEHQRWNQSRAEPLRKSILPHGNNRDPDRRLRIGYVSGDFREHVVGRNLLPILREHDRGQVEIFCYANRVREDNLTLQIRDCADSWRSIFGLSDSRGADLIRADRIDILVDLSVHTAGNRLLIFAQKPAPVQATYLGYCSSTGLETMDYRLSDPYLDPPESDLSVYTERTIRLPESYWCYSALGPTPEPSPPPVEATGYITFGCLNKFAKVSAALDLWAEILQSVERSRLIVHSLAETHLDAVRKRFADNGISPDRLEFPGRQAWPEYVRTYGRIDIALDPFPWGGGITTCDALWMGVPVVSLNGRTAVGRGGVSILSNIGLPELVARTPRQYVEIAAGLAGDLPRLAELRRTLRQRMESSPLMDARRFARNIEAAYRKMWRNWCAE
jgi:protein O-GlcNAc transferase